MPLPWVTISRLCLEEALCGRKEGTGMELGAEEYTSVGRRSGIHFQTPSSLDLNLLKCLCLKGPSVVVPQPEDSPLRERLSV